MLFHATESCLQHNVAFNCVRVRGLLLYTFPFSMPYKKKSGDVRWPKFPGNYAIFKDGHNFIHSDVRSVASCATLLKIGSIEFLITQMIYKFVKDDHMTSTLVSISAFMGPRAIGAPLRILLLSIFVFQNRAMSRT